MTDMEMKEDQVEEFLVQPKYPAWKRFLLEPIVTRKQFTLKGWHLPHLILWGGGFYLWQTMVESNLLKIPWIIYLWGPILLAMFLVIDSQRFHRFLTYLGWFYLLRGSKQEPIMDLLMGSTAKVVVRLSNALAFGALLWFSDFSLFWLARVYVPGLLLLEKFIIYLLFFYIVFWAIDQFWIFRRTRMALVMTIFMWLISAGVLWFWFEITSDIVICPGWLCPV